MEEIYSWIKNILIYMIINTIIMNLVGNKSYKKYISIVSGMILVLIVISPVIRLMKLEGNLDFNLQAYEFSMEDSDFKNDLAAMEEEQMDALFADRKEKIRTQVEQQLSEESLILKSIEVTFDENTQSLSFGELKSLKITAEGNGTTSDSGSKDHTIEDIEAIRIIIGDPGKTLDPALPSPIEIRIKNKLSDFYNLEQGNINISVQGE